MDRKEIVKLLRENYCEVTFTKKDGTTRVMKCTLLSGYLENLVDNEVIDAPDENSTKTRNEDVICVVDVEKEAWRSFRVDSVQSVKSLTDTNMPRVALP